MHPTPVGCKLPARQAGIRFLAHIAFSAEDFLNLVQLVRSHDEVDVAAVAQIARKAGVISVCDNTWAPIIQRPLELGTDFTFHSTTKYFGGHCDVMGGIVIAKRNDDFFERVRTIQYTGGAVPSPFDCWLVLRGMKTLPLRVRAHSENAAKVADYLAQHRNVERVYYPGLKSHPGHEVGKKQMSSIRMI